MNRREFLTHSAAAMAVGSVMARTANAQPSDANAGQGQFYMPRAKVTKPVVGPGEFTFASARLDHAHIYGMSQGLVDAGATLKWVYDPDPAKVKAFLAKFPNTKAARSMDEIYQDGSVKLVAAAAVTSERGPFGCEVMKAGKDYFTDKAPFTTMAQLDEAKKVVDATGKKYMVSYSERLQNESAMYATDILKEGVIGKVVQVVNLAPHRLSKETRPDWFWIREKFGGILCDIGSHQFEQFLTYTNTTEAIITNSAVGNFNNPDKPEFEDFGEANLIGNTGALNYVMVNWYTPDGMPTWGDGRTFIFGTQGTIELRKYTDIGHDKAGDQVYIVDEKGVRHLSVNGKVGFRFFGEFILDCIHRTEIAMTQHHAFKAAEMGIKAQEQARRLTGRLS